MLTRMEFYLDEGLPLSCRSASLFQGVLMEKISPVYGEILHRSELKPYSQYLDRREEKLIWVLQTFTDTASAQLIDGPALAAGDTLYLSRLDLPVKIISVKRAA